MSPVIRVSDDLFARLESHAKGFDSPANVSERMLNSFEGVEESPDSNHQSKKRDMTKYRFEGKSYGKGRLVLAVVKQCVAENRKTTFKELADEFPKEVQGSSGVFVALETAEEIYERTNHKRHFIKPNETIKLKDGTVAVCTEWGSGNIEKFLELTEALGYEIESTSSS